MDNFKLLQPLGKGGFGAVQQCRSGSGNFYAMKNYYDESQKTAIKQELILISNLKHDNVVKLMTAFIHEKSAHAVFELLKHSIQDELDQLDCGLQTLKLKKYSFQILRAVDFIHSSDIIHGDVKPGNLLVSSSGIIKLADFGSACNSNADVSDMWEEGTPWYRAPEMLLKDHEYSKSVDVWAIGCTLVFMAKGRHLLKTENFQVPIEEIVTKVGPLTDRQMKLYLNMKGIVLSAELPSTDLKKKYDLDDLRLAELVEACLQMDPKDRLRCSALLGHTYFTQDQFHERFPKELKELVDKEQSLKVEEPFPPIAWEEFQKPNGGPSVEMDDKEKSGRLCCFCW